MVVVVAAGDADRAQVLLQAAGETVHRVGTVVSGGPASRDRIV
jgi:phosphoribosylaminoimidazole (AIR) synthetase